MTGTTAPRISEEARALHESSLVVDMHADSLMAAKVMRRDFRKRHRPPRGWQPWLLHADVPRLREGGVDAVCCGIVTHPFPAGARKRARASIQYARGVLAKGSRELALAGSPGDIRRARGEGRIAVLFGIEGMHMLSGGLEAIEEFYGLGARYVTLAHFTSNAFAVSSADPFRATARPGGRLAEALDLMTSLGMMIDLAHVHTDIIEWTCRRSRVPVIVSHGACAALRPTFRNLTDSDIRNVTATGGVVGVIYATGWLTPRGHGAGLSDIVDHADHVRGLVGAGHVALGSDWDGLISTPPDLPDAAALPALTQAFLDRGYDPDEVRGVLGGNFMRVFTEVCAARPGTAGGGSGAALE